METRQTGKQSTVLEFKDINGQRDKQIDKKLKNRARKTINTKIGGLDLNQLIRKKKLIQYNIQQRPTCVDLQFKL